MTKKNLRRTTMREIRKATGLTLVEAAKAAKVLVAGNSEGLMILSYDGVVSLEGREVLCSCGCSRSDGFVTNYPMVITGPKGRYETGMSR